MRKEDFGMAVLEREPGQRQLAEAAAHARGCIADFDDQDALRRQVLPRAGDDALDDGEPVAGSAQAGRGLGAMLARQAPHLGGGHVGRVAHDDIVAPRSEAFIDVGARARAPAVRDGAAGRFRGPPRSAAGDTSVASTLARGSACAAAMAMQPEPVPMSSTRLTRAGCTQGAKPARQSSAIGERGTSTSGVTRIAWPANQLMPVR